MKGTKETKEYWLKHTWGKLTLDPDQELPNEWAKKSNRYLKFICDCGHAITVKFCAIGKSCGKCAYKPKEFWLEQKFGELTLNPEQKLPNEWAPFSDKQFACICSCGNITHPVFKNMSMKRTISCGSCHYLTKEEWLGIKYGWLTIVDSVELPDRWGSGYSSKIKFACKCGKTISIWFNNAISGATTSCGCKNPGKTMDSIVGNIYRFLSSILSEKIIFSHWIGDGNHKKEYDIYIPSKKIAVEYHGLIWHSEKFMRRPEKDYEKYLLATSLGDRLIQIYQDEWDDKQDLFKIYLQELLTERPKILVEPTCDITYSRTTEIDYFLNLYHYLGESFSDIYVLARYKDEIIGCFGLTSSEEYMEINRICWNPNYENRNDIVIALIISYCVNNNISEIIGLSDNRLFTGNIFCNMGFHLIEELPPNYQYTNGHVRISKDQYDKMTNAKNYHRIWNSGYKKYILNLKK